MFFPTTKKGLFFFFVRVLIVTTGLSYVFLTHLYSDDLAVDGPIVFGFPLPACGFSSGDGIPVVKNCSRTGQATDILLALLAGTVIMLVFRQIGGPEKIPKNNFPSSG